MSDHLELLLVGAGPMAVSYAEVLKAQDIPFVVSGRSQTSATQFHEKTGVMPQTGGLSQFLQNNPVPETAIVATTIEMLAPCTIELLNAGVKNILLEKPGALDQKEISEIAKLTALKNARVIIAYNRRFYASVAKARKMIEEDGGLREVYFEFTEWAHVIRDTPKLPAVKAKWFLANSTHVVDLAFHLAGQPADWNYWVKGGNDWHPTGTRFVGAGVTDQDILFSYQADWESPGRWSVELVTPKRRLYLKPMEKLQVQQIGSVQVEPAEIDDTMEKQLKPGLYHQLKSFMNKEDRLMCTVAEQEKNWEYYNRIAGYTD